ncbi:MAG: ribonuclease HII, partial [Chloroflexi bacterium]
MPHLLKENALRKQGFRFIAGLDEAGRGAWAGPVVAAAVILPINRPNLTTELAGLDDSKRLSAKRRTYYFEKIGQIAQAFSVGLASAEEVDTLNVVGATRLAMQRTIAGLNPAPDFLL